MKNNKGYFIIFLFFIAVGFFSCEEEGPYIKLQPDPVDTSLVDTTFISDSTFAMQQKNVLIEDFTGVRCSNCPKAAIKIHTLDSTYPGRIIAAGIHVTPQFSTPYEESKEDYRIEEGGEIYDKFGQKPLPAGDVDRNLFSGESSVLTDYNKWPNYTSMRINTATPVSITLNNTMNEDSSSVKIHVEIVFTQNITGKKFLTVYVTEDNIIDYQLMPTNGKNPTYQHNHVLRKVVTPYDGLYLTIDNPEKNRVFIKEFRVAILPKWKIKDLNTVAFVHSSGQSQTVDQVMEAKVAE